MVRKDQIKNKATVAREAIKDPLATQDELVKKTWLSKWTVNKNMQELDQTWLSSQIIDRVLWMDDEILELVNWLHLRDIREKVKNKEKLTLQDHKLLWDLANNSTKRKAIFWSKDTKPVWEVIIQL